MSKQTSSLAEITLFLALAFGRLPDGQPGKSNDHIRGCFLKDFKDTHESQQQLAVAQWEVVDTDDLPQNIEIDVVPPPPLHWTDIRTARAIAGMVNGAETGLHSILRARLRTIGVERLGTHPHNVAVAFNRLLQDRELFRAFREVLDFEDLRRFPDHPVLRNLTIEKRSMPAHGDGRTGLRKYQAGFVNRLILESLFNEEVLARGRYLTGQDVIAHGLQVAHQKVAKLGRVILYGHPAHVTPRSLDQLRETLVSGYGWKKEEAEKRTEAADCSRVEFDENSAQVWVRSQQSWELYERTMKEYHNQNR